MKGIIMSNPVCTVMVGLPALGKSTFISSLKTDENWIYSTDMFIDAVAEDNGITYSEAFASNIQSATDFNEQKLKTMILLQRDVIWDQTNLGQGKRRKIINRMKQAGYTVNCICLLPPEPGHLDDQKAWAFRLRNRPGKVIPNHVISNMIESFVVPSLAEGFDAIRYYNMYGIEVKYEPDS
jgi:predicted kinase